MTRIMLRRSHAEDASLAPGAAPADGADAWVQRGLAAAASVMVHAPAAVAEGARVKPRKA